MREIYSTGTKTPYDIMKMSDLRLSVVIPCYNEKSTIRGIVDMVRAAPVQRKEIIIVDDCSNDGTKEILRNEIAPLVSKILFHEKNQGKGASLRTGIAAATGAERFPRGRDRSPGAPGPGEAARTLPCDGHHAAFVTVSP